MLRLRALLFTLVVIFAAHSLIAQATVPVDAPSQAQSQHPPTAKPAYSLPPEKLKQAIEYSRIRIVLYFLETGWGILQLILLLALGVAARMRNVAVNMSKNPWAQGFTFTFLLLFVTTLLNLPLDMVGHRVSIAFGQSVQHWGSWFGDLAKSFGLTFLFGGLFVMLLFWVIRKSPTRWWFWFWIPAMIAVVLGVFVVPVLIDPLFNKFEPLAQSNPDLVARLEKVVQRGGINIPPERMFLMKASEKVTGLNAYVTGIGSSKRVVVWDNSIAKATPDEISYIFGHEMGHYVLNHIPKTLVFLSVLLLIEFYLGYRGMQWLIRRYGVSWRIPSQNDWAALVVLLLVFSVLSFLSEPIINGFSRSDEHAADVYGQEAVHGIVADPQATAQHSFQVLGEQSLTDPNPNRFVEFWTFSHPSISRRAAFAAAYNPWVPGQHPKYFPK
ncbi:MAG TPA: M48 family metalloprotease [Edaphobacter sp.]